MTPPMIQALKKMSGVPDFAAMVAGVILLRIKSPKLERSYKAWGYPVTPILFIVANVWITYSVVVEKFDASMIGISIIASGLVLYYFLRHKSLK